MTSTWPSDSPVDEKMNPATVGNDTLKVTKRCEEELGEERVFFKLDRNLRTQANPVREADRGC